MAYGEERSDFGAERRRRRDLRRESRAATGFDEKALYKDILAAQQGLVAQGQKVGREAQQAAQAAGAIEAGKLFAARGLPGGTEEVLRGAMSAAQARELGESEAARKGELLRAAEGVGTQMVEKEAAKASRKAEKKLRRASEAGTFMGMLGSLGGLATGASGALTAGIPAVAAPLLGAGAVGGPAAIPLLAGGLIASGLGAIGSAATQGARGGAQRELSKIAGQAASFEAPGTEGISNVLGAGPGYEGFQTSFLGGQGSRRRRRTAEESPLYRDYLGSLSYDSY